jgi:hypothetical protein
MVADGGTSSTPGFVDCGGKTCDLSTSVCCLPVKADAGLAACVPSTVTCAVGVGVIIACDESADCQHGNVCCVGSVTGAQTCQTQCPVGDLHACRCQQECASNPPCTTCPAREVCGGKCG